MKKIFWSGLMIYFINLNQINGDVIDLYKMEMKKEDAKFSEFNGNLGKDFFYLKNKLPSGEVMSCTTCHTENPKGEGLTKQNKVILPMATVVNPQRYTDLKKVEKWFKRNCDDVFKRPCTTLEKGNFIQYMNSIK